MLTLDGDFLTKIEPLDDDCGIFLQGLQLRVMWCGRSEKGAKEIPADRAPSFSLITRT